MIINENDLSKLEIEQTNSGFIVRITEKVKRKPVKHWIINASVVLTEGRISISEDDCESNYIYLINFDSENSQLKLVKK